VTAVNSNFPAPPTSALSSDQPSGTPTGPATTASTNPSSNYDAVVFIFGGFGEALADLDNNGGQGVGLLAKQLRAQHPDLKVVLYADNECGNGDGYGIMMDEFVNDYTILGITKYAIIGYSQGAGIAFNFSKAIDSTLGSVNAETNYSLFYTAYIDGVQRFAHEIAPWPTLKNRPVDSLYNDNFHEDNSRANDVPHGQALIDAEPGDSDHYVLTEDNNVTPVYHTTIDQQPSILGTIENNLYSAYQADPLP
jgi:hypothetical protein